MKESYSEGLATHTDPEPCGAVREDGVEALVVRQSERNITRSRGSAMLQWWLGTVWLYCEQQFKRVKGFAGIVQVIAAIEAEHAEQPPASMKKAA